MSWLGYCTRCGEPTISTKSPGYRESDYVTDGSGFGVRHLMCPSEVPGSETWLWQRHEFIWGHECGQEDCSESCYEFGSHLSYAEEARVAGFGYCPDFHAQGYQRWLLNVFSQPQPLVQAPLPASASPIEKQFWEAHCRLALPELKDLVPQHKAGPYKIDFALPGFMIGIELDGLRNHSKTEDITRDHVRQRWLEELGWRITRFGGSEVYHDAASVVRQAARSVRRWTAT
jgi:very-short-patch-repair endonuclease